VRRDVYIENDSGGFSVLAADAVDDIIETRAKTTFASSPPTSPAARALRDDSMPVASSSTNRSGPTKRRSGWRASWQIETSDGRMLVMAASIRRVVVVEGTGRS